MNTYKMKMIKPLLILIFMGITSCGQENRTIVKHDESSLKGIWLDTPAKSWFEAIPIGNGRLGGMVYGGIDIDTIKINEETLWSGEPRDIQNRHGLRSLPQIRQLIAEQ
ncbi:MAG TPA: glycoside hydrolase N-terminal domain-containing protein, partial [Arenibacter sp.]|nr:glycoside hydrolase N-terminal domain-containing protein [Arenibacter sp.]